MQLLRTEAAKLASEARFDNLVLHNDVRNQRSEIPSDVLYDKLTQPDSKRIPVLNGCVFNNHEIAVNYGASALEHMLNERKANKKMLTKYPKDSPEYRHYDLLQAVFKVIANSYYGIHGAPRAFVYHPHLGPAVTYTGWGLIQHMITTFEDFTDNPRFRDVWEAVAAIDLIVSSTREMPGELHTPDIPMLYQHVLQHCECGFVDAHHMLYCRICDLTDEQRTRVYYAYSPSLYFQHTDRWKTVLFGKDTPHFNVFEMRDTDLGWYIPLVNDLLNACCYPRVLANRDMHVDDSTSGPYNNGYGYSMRRITILSDTDSTFLNFGYWIHFFRRYVDFDKTHIENVLLQFFIYLYQEIARSGIELFCRYMNVPNQYIGLISMKNEYVISRAFLTDGKRNYISYITHREGRYEPKVDIKGLNFMKSSTSKTSRERITRELVEGLILQTDRISVSDVLQWIDDFVQSIERSVMSGSLEYATPQQVGEASRYAKPESMGQLRGAVLWNYLYPDNMINPPAKCHVMELNVFAVDEVDALPVNDSLKDRLRNALQNDWMLEKYGAGYISMPYSLSNIPEELLPLIDINSVIEKQISNIKPILRSLGVHLHGTDSYLTNQMILKIDPTCIQHV
jgi:hypothetical protein